MRAMKMNKKVAIVSAGLLLASAGGAFAYWTTTGSGSGTAATGTTTGVVVFQTNTPAALFPGGAAQALSGDFTSPNSGAVSLASITAGVTSVTGSGTDSTLPACTTADYVIAGGTGAVVVPAGNGSTHVGAWSGLTVQLVNSTENQDNCKGATAVITYTAHPVAVA
ncbi:MAG: hypothetical protein ACOH1Y_10975 [Propionicimonas sp.]